MAAADSRRSSGSTPPWMIPNTAWPVARGVERPLGPAVGARHRLGDVGARQSRGRRAGRTPSPRPSRAAAWISIARSGVSRWVEPSRCDVKVTPSSSTRRRSARLKTWKPPESVRIGPSQAMNRCSPPRRAIRSAVGRRFRWYVFPRIICAPAARRSPGVSAFTVAWVPTGMNWGVSTTRGQSRCGRGGRGRRRSARSEGRACAVTGERARHAPADRRRIRQVSLARRL